MDPNNPKLFVSYCWTSEDHEQWVLNLATVLREAGVNVILDKWDLREGHDAYQFMEQMVSDPGVQKVILVCDRKYAEKADKRSGGVGIETQIISPDIYAKQKQDKFVAVVKERDEQGNPCLPTYYKSRIFIDLSTEDDYGRNFDQLLRWIYDKPLHIKPQIGKKPAFLDDETTPALGTTVYFQRALDSIRNSRANRQGALTEYFDRLADSFEVLRLKGSDRNDFDEDVIKSVEAFLPYRTRQSKCFSPWDNTIFAEKKSG